MKRIQGTVRDLPSVIPVSLTQGYNQLGISDELEKYVKEETALAINPVVDKELIRVKPSLSAVKTIVPRFKSINDGNNYLHAGFSLNKIQQASDSLMNSIFIFEYFDSPNSDSQTKLGFNFVKADAIGTFQSTYTPSGSTLTKKAVLSFSGLGAIKEFNMVYLPSYLMSGNEVFSVFMQVSFFNALTGNMFYFRSINGDSDAKNYLELLVNPINKTYEFTSDEQSILIDKYDNANSIEEEDNGTNTPKTHIKTKRGYISELINGKFKMESFDGNGYKIKYVTVANTDWYDDGVYEIRWDYTGTTEQVKISVIYQDNGYDKVIVNTAPCTGSYTYKSDNDTNGLFDDDNFIDSDYDGYNDIYNTGFNSRKVLIKVEIVGNPYEYGLSDSVTIYKSSAPPIEWGTPSIPDEWYKNNEYTITYNIPNQVYQGVDIRDKMHVEVGLEYTDSFGNMCKPIVNILTCATVLDSSAVSGSTGIWANELTLFNADYSRGYAEVTVKLIDISHPTNILTKVVKYYNQKNGTSTDYKANSNYGPTPAPSNPIIEFTDITKPISSSTIYGGRQMVIDWSPKIAGRSVRVGYVFYDTVKGYYNFWVESSFFNYSNPNEGLFNPFKTVPADSRTIYTPIFNLENWNGSEVDGFIIVQDSDYIYGNFIKAPVRLSKLSPPTEAQEGLVLTPNSIVIQHTPYEGYDGVISHTQFLDNQPYSVTWGEINEDTYVNISLIYTNPIGDIEKLRLNMYDKINDGSSNISVWLVLLRMDEGTTIDSVVRVSDEFDESKFIDSTIMTIEMPLNYYYDYGYNQGYILKTFNSSEAYDDTPPSMASSIQAAKYKDGYAQGYNDGTPWGYMP
jgi:hypothetical protein